MPEVILPCPACGSVDCECLFAEDEMYSVDCVDCSMRAPAERNPDSAISAWNTLPRALRWTHELPKVTGTFFVRDIRYKEEAGLVYISSQQAARLLDKGPSPFIQYAGPISPPIEP